MIPIARVFAGGTDVTGSLSDRLLSVEVTDEAENKSDRCAIRIDAREVEGQHIAIPEVGTELEVYLGYQDGPIAKMGKYKVDDIDIGEPPLTIQVGARSADMTDSFRTPKEESHHDTTLGDIAKKIAGRNGYEAVVDPELADVPIPHIDQARESDMSFMARLAKKYDGTAKPTDGKLVVAKRGSGKAVSGADVQPVFLTPRDCEEWSWRYSAREDRGKADKVPGKGTGELAGDGSAAGKDTTRKPGGVRATWHDFRTGDQMEVTVGDPPYRDLRNTFHNEAEAIAAAEAASNQQERGRGTFSCTIGGNPTVGAEAKLTLEGFHPAVPTELRIKSVTHSYDGSGYKTKITAELFEPEQKKPGASAKKAAGKKHPDDNIKDDNPNVIRFDVEGGGKTPGGSPTA